MCSRYCGREEFGITVTREDVRSNWGVPAGQFFPRLLNMPDTPIEVFQEAFWKYDGQFPRQLHEDVLPTLAALRSGGMVLGIVTGGLEDRVLGYMRQAALPLEWFEFIHTGNPPSGEPVLARAVRHLEGLGITPNRTLFVGDEPTDVRNAAAVNVDFVAIRRAGSHISIEQLAGAGVSPERIIDDLRKLPALLGVQLEP